MRKLSVLLALLILFAIAGCKNSKNMSLENISAADLQGEPLIQNFKDPDVDLSQCNTFTIMRASDVTDSEIEQPFGNKLLEKEMQCLVRNDLELWGYVYVEPNQKPDFIVVVTGSNEYKTSYIPPQAITLPTYIPRSTVKINSTINGTVNIDGSYGRYSQSGTSTTNLPGQWTTQTYQIPGRQIGNFYPCISFNAYDGKTGKSIWYCCGVGISKNPDIRVSGQWVMYIAAGKFPKCINAAQHLPSSSGYLGIRLVPFTSDGNSTHALVVYLTDDSPAKKTKMQQFDIVLDIDGVSTQDKGTIDLFKMLSGKANTESTFTILRGKKVFDVKVKRVEQNEQ